MPCNPCDRPNYLKRLQELKEEVKNYNSTLENIIDDVVYLYVSAKPADFRENLRRVLVSRVMLEDSVLTQLVEAILKLHQAGQAAGQGVQEI
jgi:hypothetical protein